MLLTTKIYNAHARFSNKKTKNSAKHGYFVKILVFCKEKEPLLQRFFNFDYLVIPTGIEPVIRP